MEDRTVEFQIGKNALTGGPVVKVVVPPASKFEDIIRVQEILFTDVITQLPNPLESHPACMSGIDAFTIEERFQNIIRIEL